MSMKYFGIFAIAALAAGVSALPASAMTMKDCSAKYQDAKKAGTLNGQDWNTFRSAQCGSPQASQATDANAGAAPAATAAAAPAGAAPVADTKAATKPAAPAVAPSGLALPNAIDPKFASEKPARGRLHTCAAAYKLAKQAGTLQGLRWIQKGGGYYSLCNKKIKAGA